MFIKGDGNCVNLSNEALLTYNNNIYMTLDKSLVHASYHLDKVRYTIKETSGSTTDGIRSQITSTEITLKFKVGDYVRNADKRNFFSKEHTSN